MTTTTTQRTCQGCQAPLVLAAKGQQRKWCSERCRKRTLYSSICVDCGARCRTNDRLPVQGHEYRCATCSPKALDTVWSTEDAIAAAQAWAIDHGGRTPNAEQYRREEPRTLPTHFTVVRLFGGHKEYVAAAGLKPLSRGPSVGFQFLTAEDRAKIPLRVTAGESYAEIGADLDCSSSAVARWAKRGQA